MTEDHPAAGPDLQRQLDLLHELGELVHRQDRIQQAAAAESRRLRLVIEAAGTRLGAMLSGERASRAALQAVIDDLRTAIGAEDTGDGEAG